MMMTTPNECPAYWRMQLHPADSANSIRLASQSLSAGFIGLDFETDVGDLTVTTKEQLPEHQRRYRAFYSDMKVGDIVLVMAHDFPYAICRVAGEYNFILRSEPDLGVWFRHFRRIELISIYGDAVIANAKNWPRIKMRAALDPLHHPQSASRKLIDDWLKI